MDNFIVGNVGVDENSSNKYTAVAVSDKKKFNIPPSMNRCAFMQVGDDMVDFIAQNNIQELDSYEYDKSEINDKLETLKNEINAYISDITGVEDNTAYRSELANDDRFSIRNASR